MGKLLRFEFRKLFRMKSFYICLGVLVAIVFIGVWSTYMLDAMTRSMTDMMEKEGVTFDIAASFRRNSLYFLLTGIANSNFEILMAIVISLFVCADYSCGAMKTVVARGYKRSDIVISKFLTAMVISVIYSLTAMLVGFLCGGLFFGFGGEFKTAMIGTLLLQLLITCASTAFFFCLSSLLKKTGGTIAICIVSPLVLSLVLTLVDAFRRDAKILISDYWISNLLSNLSALNVGKELMLRAGISGLVYIVVLGFISYLASIRTEV